MHYYSLSEAIDQNNLDPSVVLKVEDFVISRSRETKKFCIFNFQDRKLSDLKFYDSIDEPNKIMLSIAKKV